MFCFCFKISEVKMFNIKRASAFILIALLMLFMPAAALTASAEGGAAIFVSPKASAGDTLDVIITFTSDSPIGWVETNLVYDESILTYTEGDFTGGNGIIHIRDFPDENNRTFSIGLKFMAVSVGETKLSLANCVISSSDGIPVATPSAEADITVSETAPVETTTDGSGDEPEPETTLPEESSVPEPEPGNTNLLGLSFSTGTLLPDFSPEIYQYTLKIDSDTDRVEVSADKSEEDYIWFKCSTWFDESEDVTRHVFHIMEDETRLIITLNDDDGNESVYTVIVQRSGNTDTSSQESAVTTTTASLAESLPDTTVSADHKAASDSSETSGMEDLKKTLMPALFIVLAVLVIALVILLKWIGGRSDRKRKKIKSSSSKK